MRLKILILTNLFPTPWDPLRGAFNRQQFERLGQRHEVDVLTAVDFRERMGGVRGEVKVAHLHTDHFVFFYPPRIGRSLHAVTWLLSLWLQRGRKLRAAGYDCLLVSWAYPDAAAAGWLARRLGIPYVVKVHGSDLNVQANFPLRRRQIRSALRGAGAVVAVSQALADKAIAIGADATRVHVLYNGVDSALFAPGSRSAARAQLQLAADAPLLLYVGNLKASKGCLDLLEAFPALLAARPQSRLVYVGSGPARSQLLERAAALGCAGQLTLAGTVAHDGLGDWFRAADLLCLPSHNEGVPNVVLEAMACGTPVVASAVGGIPEVVPEYAGILVPPRDRGALSAALIAASEREWNTTRIAVHASGFRWGDNIGRLDYILQEVAASPTLPRCARMNFRPKKQHLLGLLPVALVQTHGPRQGQTRFLSFDDGPHPEHTPRLLDLLAAHQVQASFFVVGERAERHPALIQRIVSEGHLLGNHSWSHKRFAQMSLTQQVAEIDRADVLLATFDQVARHRIRPPQGHLSLPLLMHFARQRRSVAYWSYDSLDYQPQPVAGLIARLRDEPPRAGDIVLMHDDGAPSGQALATLLPLWLAEGHTFHAMPPEHP